MLMVARLTDEERKARKMRKYYCDKIGNLMRWDTVFCSYDTSQFDMSTAVGTITVRLNDRATSERITMFYNILENAIQKHSDWIITVVVGILSKEEL